MGITKISKTSVRFQFQCRGTRYNKTVKIYGKTKQDLEVEYGKWQAEIYSGGNVVNNNITFSEFAHRWLEEFAIPKCKPLVIKNYKSYLKNWIEPRLGNTRLVDFTPMLLNQFIGELFRSNTKFQNRSNASLSNGSIKKIYSIIRAILQEAYRDDLISNNPCSKFKLQLPTKVGEEKLHYWDKDTCLKALELLEKETVDNKYAVIFALKTGLRRSEIFGLTWADVDLENKTITVNKTRQKNPNHNNEMEVMTCKNLSSVRKISIPGSLVLELKEYREKATSNFVFTMDYDCLTAWFRKWQKKNNLPQIRFHDLRHTHATLLLYKNVDIKTISKRLGHSNISTTMNVYTHVMEELDRNASSAIDNL